MRSLTIMVSACFVLLGMSMVLGGEPKGCGVALFFGGCLLVAMNDEACFPSDRGRWVGLLASLLMASSSVLMRRDDPVWGWVGIIFFGLCALGFLLQGWLPQAETLQGDPFIVIANEDHVGVEYPAGENVTVRWSEIDQVILATTSDGPWLDDMFLIFLAGTGQRALRIPSETAGFEKLFDHLGRRLPGFDFQPFAQAGTDDEQFVCWERKAD